MKKKTKLGLALLAGIDVVLILYVNLFKSGNLKESVPPLSKAPEGEQLAESERASQKVEPLAELERERQEAKQSAGPERAQPAKEPAVAARKRQEEELRAESESAKQPAKSTAKKLGRKPEWAPGRERLPEPERAQKQAKSTAESERLPTEARQAPPSLGPLDAVDQILERMQLGNIAFNTPTSMNLYGTAAIQLLLGVEKPIKELLSILPESPGVSTTRPRCFWMREAINSR